MRLNASTEKSRVLPRLLNTREISVSIILQNIAQLKALYEKQWESIVGNCDELLYLGGNEPGTHEMISKLLGKESIYLDTYGKSPSSVTTVQSSSIQTTS